MARSGQGEGLKESAALCILARDCGEALPSFLKSVETLRSSVAGSRVFIVENNSRDSTKEILQDYADSTPGVVLDSFDDPEYDSLERIERMTLLRNRCLDLVYRDGFRADLLIVADGDIEFDASSVIGAGVLPFFTIAIRIPSICFPLPGSPASLPLTAQPAHSPSTMTLV